MGEIQDEYDTDEDENIKKISDQVYLISGLMNVSDLNEELSLQIHEADSYDSIGGFMVEHLGKLPAKGGVYEDEYVKMIILNVQKRRITRVRLEIKQGGDQDRES
ncbi:MAG: transporter associated domain-containing protein [Candidatus Margulisiibacteriota bacterium]